MAIDPSSEDVEQVLKDATGGLGVDVAIETSAVYQALDQAIRGLAFNGTVAVARLGQRVYWWIRSWSCSPLQHSQFDLRSSQQRSQSRSSSLGFH